MSLTETPDSKIFIKLFVYSNLKYIFAVRKGGAIAHPDSYREVEQWSLCLKLGWIIKNNAISYGIA